MKHLKLFFALFAMLALGVGNAWGAEETFDWSSVTTTQLNLASANVYTEGSVTLTFAKANGSNWPAENKEGSIRMYSNTTLTISCASGNITKVVFTSTSNSYTAANLKYNGTALSGNEWTLSSPANEVLLTASANARFKKIVVTYETASGGGETPDPEPDPTTYTIKWHTAKGVTTDVTLNEGATITKPATDPTMTGYEFRGWTTSCEVASDGAGFTAIENFGTADSDKDFYAVFAVATTTGGGAATETTASVVIKDYASAKNWTNSTKYTTVEIDANITATVTEGTNTGKYYQSGFDWRLYQTESAKLTISAKNDLNIKTVKVTYNYSNGGVLKLNSTNVTSGTVQDVNASSITFSVGNTGSATNGQVKVTKMEVVYTSGGGGTTTYSDYITTCASGIEYVELGDDFKWNATEAEVTIDATDNVFPTLTNTYNVPVTYSSTDDAIASIASDGTVTLNKEGTVTITAKYEGGASAGTGKEYKAKSVTYSLKVNKAVAQPTGTMYVKVTDAVTDGEYLIVYEDASNATPAPVAFNGALATEKLDVASNYIEVSIASNTIAGNTDIDAAIFTIDATAGTIQTKDGYYIGQTSNANGLATSTTPEHTNTISIENDGSATIISSGGAYLRYNSNENNWRFRYFKSSTYTAQKAIALYKKVDPNAVVEPVFTPVAGEYYGTQSVTISCATAGAEVYYTLDGTDPTSASTKYTGAISIASTTTVKAIAIKGANSSEVVSATYTILAPLATMQEIFDKATDATQSVHIKFNDWVISGVVPGKDGKPSSNAYITDGSKGFIIYNKDGHGFNVGNKLSGTVVCDLTRYNGSAEVVGLTSSTEGLTVTAGGTVTTNVLDAEGIAALTGVNTGSVIKISGTCTVVDSRYYVAGVQLYNSLYTYTNPEEGYNYECTGVYLQYKTNSADVKEILPRKAEDLVKLTEKPTASISIENITVENRKTAIISATITPAEAASAVTYTITSGSEYIALNGTEITANAVGTATITATIADCEDYYGATQDFTVTVTAVDTRKKAVSPSPFEAVSGDMNPNDITFASYKGGGTGGPNIDENCIQLYQIASGSEYGGYITFTAIEGCKIDQVKIVTAENSTTVAYSADDEAISANTDVAEGDEFLTDAGLDAQSVNIYCMGTDKYHRLFVASAIVYYTVDTRAEAGIAWSTDAINLTVGDAFTAPTFSNPNTLTGITFTSSNEALATVDAGVISLVSGKTGTATITASFKGNETYRNAEVSCTISVNPVTDDVVILAQHNGQWYAMMAQCPTGQTMRLAALPVEYINGTLYNVSAENQALITWSRAFIENQVAFQNNGNYLKGVSSTDLILEAEETGLYLWDKDTYTMTINGTVRTFLYSKTNNCFRNYVADQASNGVATDVAYSSLPVVTAPEYATAIKIGSGDNSIVIGENVGQPVNVIVDRAFEAGDEWYTLCVPFNMDASVIGTAYQLSGLVQKGANYVQVNLAAKTTIEAGQPYLIKPSVSVSNFVVEKVTIVNTTGESIEKSISGLSVTMQGVINGDGTTGGLYWVGNSGYLYNDDVAKSGLRTYFNISTPSGIAPRMRVVAGENVETGVEDIITTDAPVKVIENGQLIIIRDGVKYNVQGVRL